MQNKFSSKMSEWVPQKLFSPHLHLQMGKIRPRKNNNIARSHTSGQWLQDFCLSSAGNEPRKLKRKKCILKYSISVTPSGEYREIEKKKKGKH